MPTSCCLPFTATSPSRREREHTESPAQRRVAHDDLRVAPGLRVSACKREATFTPSPITV